MATGLRRSSHSLVELRILDSFGQVWRSGAPPNIKAFWEQIVTQYSLADSPSRINLLWELIVIDLEYQWSRSGLTNGKELASGSVSTVRGVGRFFLEDYLTLFAELGKKQEIPVDLICQECKLRLGKGDWPSLEEYARRFPELGNDLLNRLRPLLTHIGTSDRDASSPGLPEIPGYHILDKLGQGGMGVVYRAEQIRLKRPVAIKMLANSWADAEDLGRFRNEAEAVARLQHPNIVQIFEVGECGKVPFFSMELIAGGGLDQKLKGKVFPPRQAAILLETLAGAIHYAHCQGIVHRDLKPANVLVTKGKFTPKISDFGLAKKLDSSSLKTQTGAVIGTPSYMAPEQAKGTGRDLGPPTDVYALGAILYELLTGRPPFRGLNVVETLEQVCSKEPILPRHLQPKVPLDLETICLKCLQKEPSKRYLTAQELAADLSRFLTGQPVKARPVTKVERLWRIAKRHPSLSILGTILAFVVLTAVPIVILKWLEANHNAEKWEQENIIAKKQENLAWEARQKANAEAELAWRNEYASEMNNIQNKWEEGYSLSTIKERLKSLLPGPHKKDIRSFEWYYYWGLCHLDYARFGDEANPATCLDFSPNEQLAAVGFANGKVMLWKLKTNRLEGTIKDGVEPVLSVAFDADGKSLFTASAQTLKIWDLETRTEKKTYRLQGKSVSFLPQRDWIIATTGEEYFLWYVTGAGEINEVGSLKPGVSMVKFSSNGTLLAARDKMNSIQVWEFATKKVLVTRKDPPWKFLAFGLSPGVPFLVLGDRDGAVQIRDAITGNDVSTLSGHKAAVTSLAFSQDGKYLVTAGYSGFTGKGREVILWDWETKEEYSRFRAFGSIEKLVLSQNGRWLGFCEKDGSVMVYDTANQAPDLLQYPQVPEPVRDVGCLAIHSNGKIIAAGNGLPISYVAPGRVVLWDLKSGQAIRYLKHPISQISSMAFFPKKADLVTAGIDSGSVKGLIAVDGISGKILQEFSTGKQESFPYGVLSLAFSPDGKRLATGSGLLFPPKPGKNPEQGELKIWNPDSGKLITSLNTVVPSLTNWSR